VHCLVLPFAMSVMPMVGASGIAFDHRTELALTVLVVASALLGGFWGYRRHRDTRIVLASAGGLAAYLVGHLLEGWWVGVALSVSGGLMLAASSFIGARLAHHCEDAGCAHSA
jgi:hypothetical protein